MAEGTPGTTDPKDFPRSGRKDAQRAEPTFEAVMQHELVKNKVEWPFSCFGMNTDWTTGNNILHGDFSPEELRFEFYRAQLNGPAGLQHYHAAVQQMLQQHASQRQAAITDLQGAEAIARTPRYSPTNMSMPTSSSQENSQYHHGQPIHSSSNVQNLLHVVPNVPSTLSQSHPRSSHLPPSTTPPINTSTFNFGEIPEVPPQVGSRTYR